MSITIPDEANYLLDSIRKNSVVLVLGAGASATSRNASGLPVRSGYKLAELLAAESGFPYNNEELADVVQAAVGPRLGTARYHAIIKREYLNCAPSAVLKQLFAFPWARTYTFNIDDCVERIGVLVDGRRVVSFNGLIDGVIPREETIDLQVIHLNGTARSPEQGLIFSRDEYNRRLAGLTEKKTRWYEELASDYFRYVPLIIGSSLKEPLLDVEIERLKQQGKEAGLGFLVTPDCMTPIQQSVFKARGILHIQADLDSFVSYLKKQLGDNLSVNSIIREEYLGIGLNVDLTKRDLETAMALRPIDPSAIRARLQSKSTHEIDRSAQLFLQGAPPSWPVVISGIPVALAAGRGFVPTLRSALVSGARLAVVIGQSGSGKSTLAMQGILSIAALDKSIVIYELSGEARSISHVFELLQKIHTNQQIILFVSDLFVYGDRLSTDLETISGNRVLVVSTSRSGEWNEHFERHLGRQAVLFELSRFTTDDFEPLTNKLLRYVPAPSFSKASPDVRMQRFAKSRNQLLIALREITESKRFDEVIEDEYNRLPDEATKRMFQFVGVATLARVGIHSSVLASVFNQNVEGRAFSDAHAALAGIVVGTNDGRVQVRHESYADYVFGRVEPVDCYISAAIAVLDSFSRYEAPVLRHVTRNDAALFKFLLNYRPLYKRCMTAGNPKLGLKIYSRFEKAFELDGHFWLQYGLYSRKLGMFNEAMHHLHASVLAFPENSYAIHALADLKLYLAAEPRTPDSTAKEYMEEAVRDLMVLSAREDNTTDFYAIGTLSSRHVHALINRNQREDAIRAARSYFNRIEEIQKRYQSQQLNAIRYNLLLFVTTGEWKPIHFEEFAA